MFKKISITMPEDIVRRLDEAARETKCSRSALLTLAVKCYLEEKIQERQRKASKEIDRIRESVEPWDATGEVLKWRDHH